MLDFFFGGAGCDTLKPSLEHKFNIFLQNLIEIHQIFRKFPDFRQFRTQFFSTLAEYFFENWKSFLDGSESFISAILVSRAKIMIPPGTHSSGRISENLKIWNLADSHHPK